MTPGLLAGVVPALPTPMRDEQGETIRIGDSELHEEGSILRRSDCRSEFDLIQGRSATTKGRAGLE